MQPNPGSLFHLGISTSYALSKPLNVQTGLFYDQKNHVDIIHGGYYADYGLVSYYDYQMNYLTIPIELQYKINIAKNIQIFATGGMFTSFGLNGRYIPSGPLICEAKTRNISTDDIESLRRMDLGGQIGGGFAFKFGLYLKANYSMGALNLSKIENNQYHSETLQFSIGFTPKIKFRKDKPPVGAGTPKL